MAMVKSAKRNLPLNVGFTTFQLLAIHFYSVYNFIVPNF